MAPADPRQLIDGIDKQSIGYEQEECARKVDGKLFARSRFGYDLPRQVGARDTEGHIHIKDPAPADGVDEKAAQRRPGEKADMKGGGSQSQGAAAILLRQIERHDGPAVSGDHRSP